MQNISQFRNVFARKIFLSLAESLFYILSENFFFPVPVSPLSLQFLYLIHFYMLQSGKNLCQSRNIHTKK